ncbi:MAG: hypothetical protein BWZ02_03339 [Lentisphaerae bacterium ADurb.BinA184]|nr:MAG: hypothetical protein BWZ02_03339 [Lentisphaerae bacterium ADurb.BinA184]
MRQSWNTEATNRPSVVNRNSRPMFEFSANTFPKGVLAVPMQLSVPTS